MKTRDRKKVKEVGLDLRSIDRPMDGSDEMNNGKEAPTRRSLLIRLKNRADNDSWRTFFETYWRLIYHMAIKAGLNYAEAEDVVQETVISVMKSMPEFEYNAQHGSFKGWLLRLTQWRITDQFRKRQRNIEPRKSRAASPTGTGTVERVADPAGEGLEKAWDEEWRVNLLDAAVERVKRKVDAKQFQIFDLYAVKQWPVSRVAKFLQVSQTRVYLAKHRIGVLIKKEVALLQTKPI